MLDHADEEKRIDSPQRPREHKEYREEIFTARSFQDCCLVIPERVAGIQCNGA